METLAPVANIYKYWDLLSKSLEILSSTRNQERVVPRSCNKEEAQGQSRKPALTQGTQRESRSH